MLKNDLYDTKSNMTNQQELCSCNCIRGCNSCRNFVLKKSSAVNRRYSAQHKTSCDFEILYMLLVVEAMAKMRQDQLPQERHN